MYRKLFIIAFLSICMLVPWNSNLNAQSSGSTVTDADSIAQPTSIDGVYFGVTFKRDIAAEHTQLEAGWLQEIYGLGWLAFCLDYDRAAETYGPGINYFYLLKGNNLYIGGGAGLNFSGESFNHTGDLRLMFAYVLPRPILGLEVAVVPRYQKTGYINVTTDPESVTPAVVSDDQSSELWISVVFLGF